MNAYIFKLDNDKVLSAREVPTPVEWYLNSGTSMKSDTMNNRVIYMQNPKELDLHNCGFELKEDEVLLFENTFWRQRSSYKHNIHLWECLSLPEELRDINLEDTLVFNAFLAKYNLL